MSLTPEWQQWRLSLEGLLNRKSQEVGPAIWERLALTRVLFPDLISSPKVLRHLLLLWPEYSWSAVLLKHATISGRNGTSIPVLVSLFLVGSSTSCIAVAGVVTTGTAPPPCLPVMVPSPTSYTPQRWGTSSGSWSPAFDWKDWVHWEPACRKVHLNEIWPFFLSPPLCLEP